MPNIVRKLFTTAGAISWTPPAGVTSVLVRGGGGAGGGGGGAGSAVTAGSPQNCGGGGGGGSKVHQAYRAVVPGVAITGTVGAGGTSGAGGAGGGNPGANGGDGGTTTMNFSFPFTCHGAGGGNGGRWGGGVPYSRGGRPVADALVTSSVEDTGTPTTVESGWGGWGRTQGGGTIPEFRNGGDSVNNFGGTVANDTGLANAGGTGGGGGAGEYSYGTGQGYGGGNAQQGLNAPGNAGSGQNTLGNRPCNGGGGGGGASATGSGNQPGGLGGQGGTGFIELVYEVG